MSLTVSGMFLALIAVCSAPISEDSSPDLDCGALVSYVACVAFGPVKESYKTFVENLGTRSDAGYSLLQLQRGIESQKLKSLTIQTDYHTLDHFFQQSRSGRAVGPIVAIVRLDGNHFVLLTEFRKNGVMVCDFPSEAEYMTAKDFNSRWKDGYALLIARENLTFLVHKNAVWPWLLGLISFLLLGWGAIFLRKKNNV